MIARIAKVTEEEIKACFFRCQLKGWASPNCVQKKTVPGFPGMKLIEIYDIETGLTFKDFYFISPGSTVSYGTTVEYDGEIPIWIMNYGGWYKKNAIHFLKRALMTQYSRGIFSGGRGSDSFFDREFLYLNQIDHSSFASFDGSEKVKRLNQCEDKDDLIIGVHRYSGGLFVR